MSITDVVMIPIIVGVVMIPTLVGWMILDEFDSAGSGVNSAYLDDGKSAMSVFNSMIIFMIVGIGISALILASQLRTHPSFSVIAILLLAIFVSLSAWLANVWWAIQNSGHLTTAANEMDNFTQIINNLPLIAAVMGVAIIIATFAKPYGGGSPAL